MDMSLVVTVFASDDLPVILSLLCALYDIHLVTQILGWPLWP